MDTVGVPVVAVANGKLTGGPADPPLTVARRSAGPNSNRWWAETGGKGFLGWLADGKGSVLLG